MNEGFPYTDLVLLALVAGFILLRLRSTLGHNAELPETPLPRQPQPEIQPEQLVAQQQMADDEDASYIAANLPESLADKIKEVRRIDPSFRARAFLEGAKMAFEMVIDAFSKGDRKTLKLLLAPAVFNGFNDEINRRKAANTTHETTLIAITSAEMADASVAGSTVKITVKFRSEQVNLVRSNDGAIIEGDPSEIEQVDDVWTFERDAKSNDPNWRLVATQG